MISADSPTRGIPLPSRTIPIPINDGTSGSKPNRLARHANDVIVTLTVTARVFLIGMLGLLLAAMVLTWTGAPVVDVPQAPATRPPAPAPTTTETLTTRTANGT